MADLVHQTEVVDRLDCSVGQEVRRIQVEAAEEAYFLALTAVAEAAS